MIAVYIFIMGVTLTSIACDDLHLSDDQEQCSSVLGKYSSAAIAVDGKPCAKIGMDVLRQGGFAADAAIAGLLCNGIYNAQSMGVGGGFIMTIYQREGKKMDTLIAREMAPSYATTNMYEGNPSGSRNGPFSMGIPGEVLGYWEMKLKYGNPDISWESLFQPSIEMCRNGIYVDWSLANSLAVSKEHILLDPGMSAIFINPENDDVWQEGEYYIWNSFGNTLERIAEYGAEEFYSGQTGQNLIADIQDFGGNMTIKDLESYSVEWVDPIKVSIGNGLTLYSVPPPGSGVIIGYVMNILQNYNITPENGDEPVLYHRIVEAFKWAYGERSKLGDPADTEITEFVNEMMANLTSTSFAHNTFTKIDDESTVNDPAYYGGDFAMKEDHGTAHLSVVAANGDAVSVTSTINLLFGSKYMSPLTGIIMNNEMDDFSYPGADNAFGLAPSPNNFVKPGKRPVSSMCPSIVIDDNGDVRSVLGAAGGSRITTSTSLTLIRNLWQGFNIKEAIDMRRLHHQLLPMIVTYESNNQRPDVVDYLISTGHNVTETPPNSVVCGIDVNPDGFIYANADRRKAGGVDGYNSATEEPVTTDSSSGFSVYGQSFMINVVLVIVVQMFVAFSG